MRTIEDFDDEGKESYYFLVKAKKDGENRYDFGDKVLNLENVLPSQLTYPEAYGIVLKTYCDDGEPLDGFVLMKESPPGGAVLEVIPIGVLRLKISGRRDEKLISVAVEDPDFSKIGDLEELRGEKLEEERLENLAEFYERYGYLNDEEIKVEGWFGRDRAEKLLKHSRKLYKRKYM